MVKWELEVYVYKNNKFRSVSMETENIPNNSIARLLATSLTSGVLGEFTWSKTQLIPKDNRAICRVFIETTESFSHSYSLHMPKIQRNTFPKFAKQTLYLYVYGGQYLRERLGSFPVSNLFRHLIPEQVLHVDGMTVLVYDMREQLIVNGYVWVPCSKREIEWAELCKVKDGVIIKRHGLPPVIGELHYGDERDVISSLKQVPRKIIPLHNAGDTLMYEVVL